MKVMTIMNDGFEELEAIGTIALLKRSGIEVDIYTTNKEEVTGRFNITLSNIKQLEERNDYDCLFIPGGPHYQSIEDNEMIKNIILSYYHSDKYIATICAAPTILGRMGLLKNRNYTCFTSMNEDFGGTYVDTYVVQDGKLITGRSAAASIDFGFQIIQALQGKEQEEKIKKEIYY